MLILATFVLQPPVEFRARSFFGVTEVLRPADGKVAILMNGTTVHGTQYTDPARRRIPGTYYGTIGPAGDIFALEAGAAGRDHEARRGRRARCRDACVLRRRPD